MTDKQIIDEERMFECVWCKYGFKESDANFILSENPNECVCSDCITEWADNLLWDFKRKTQECESLKQEIEILQNNFDTATRDCNDKIEILKQECEQIKEKYEALKLENQEGYEIVDELKQECDRYCKALEEIEEYINNQGIDNKWNMRIQRFRSGILDIIKTIDK